MRNSVGLPWPRPVRRLYQQRAVGMCLGREEHTVGPSSTPRRISIGHRRRFSSSSLVVWLSEGLLVWVLSRQELHRVRGVSEDSLAVLPGADGAAVNAALQQSGFGPARFVDLDLDPQGDFGAGAIASEDLVVVAVPNQGSAWRKWWWSGSAGATAKQLTDVINGKAWPAGKFKQDNIPKKLVALARSKLDGKFRFVVNEWKPGEAWWWGYGASIDNITAVLKGEAWADFRRMKSRNGWSC